MFEKFFLILLFITISYFPNIAGEVFTAIADMKSLVENEQYLADELRNYIRYEEIRLQNLKKFLSNIDSVLNETKKDTEKYLGNPVNTYFLIKRFHKDWESFDINQGQDNSRRFLNAYENLKPYFPTVEDYEGAMTALFRLQETYKLPSSYLAQGIIPGVDKVNPMNAEDLFALGAHAYKSNDWLHTTEWMQLALDNKQMMDDTRRFEVMDHLAYSQFKQGNIKEAHRLTKRMIEIDPNLERLHGNLEYYQNELKKSEVNGKRGDDGLLDETELITQKKITPSGSQSEMRRKRKDLIIYEQLCRGETRQQTNREQRRMKCWYKSKDPVLRIKPQKIERVWMNPEIFILRDIIRDNTIDSIKEAAYPLLRRATIQDPITGKLRHADYRVSKSAWLSPRDHEFVTSLFLRAQAATGLDLRAAEQLQVANYGIGGHYEPHFDHARETEDKFTDLNMGNRIATILFYLSSVEAGGATVFTEAKAAIFPSKNDAVFWYNLKRNGLGNPATRHAACPVLVGQKWVSNWWIHEYGQEFRRRCSLRSDI